jgi:lipocalin
MKKISILLLSTFSIMASCAGGDKMSSKNGIDTTTITSLDLQRYQGTWYEIARYDHSFERGLQGCSATYSLREDGMIKVVNAGYSKSLDGKYKESVGKARQPDPTQPGRLEVSFFWNFWGDYYILELDKEYRYVLIGSSSPKYLWILSRTPHMNQSDLDFIKARAEERGYDLSKLIWVEQK